MLAGSRFLKDAETRYSPSEEELLAIVFNGVVQDVPAKMPKFLCSYRPLSFDSHLRKQGTGSDTEPKITVYEGEDVMI